LWNEKEEKTKIGSLLGCFQVGSVYATIPLVDYLEICFQDSGGPITFASRSEISA
jgi:hypothetical protein